MVSDTKIKSIAIIPARGGSKRIPRKNIKLFFGKPIIAYSIEAALRCGLFDEVMVSTDDPEIGKIAQEFGAVVPFYRSKGRCIDQHLQKRLRRSKLSSALHYRAEPH